MLLPEAGSSVSTGSTSSTGSSGHAQPVIGRVGNHSLFGMRKTEGGATRSPMLSHAPQPVTFIEKSCTKCSNTAQYEAVHAEILHQMQQSQR